MFLEYLEIGTCDFNCECLKKIYKNKLGMCIEPLKYYLDKLPNRKNLIKVNCAIFNKSGKGKIFYVSEEDIIKLNLPKWLKGCSSLNKRHWIFDCKNHFPNGIPVKEKDVDILSFADLVKIYKIESINFLKIDTEGCDSYILENYLKYSETNKKILAKKIKFEFNRESNKEHTLKIIELLKLNNYKFTKIGKDTICYLE